ncbi:MAG TPA: glycosyltransferase family 2 protein [Candidatus Aquicultor sp.]|jgi:glycosyltransferase involved in cell wall biosynthesis
MRNYAAKEEVAPVQGSLEQPIISIVIPVYNEEGFLPTAIPDICAQLHTTDVAYELILCENGSTDNTIGIARALKEEYDGVRVLSIDHADYGRAMRAGMLAARAPYTIIFDVDYYSIDFLREALPLLESYDIVIASKLAPGTDDRRSIFRKLITRSFSKVIRMAFSTKTTETHGIKAFRTDTVLPVIERTQLAKDLFDTELIIRAERSGLAIKELPITVEERRPARSSIFKRIPRTVVGLGLLRYYLWKER